MLKVKQIYVVSAWSQRCTVISAGILSAAVLATWPLSTQTRARMKTEASSSVRGSASSTSGKHLARPRPPGGGRERACRRRTVRSNDRVAVIKPVWPRLSTAPALQVCHRDTAQTHAVVPTSRACESQLGFQVFRITEPNESVNVPRVAQREGI